jgi:D-arabinose 1-dehydrogenase-like Zn-dependent alcohol dehydrogenase
MRTQRIVAYGAPLEGTEREAPAPRGREVLVRVRHCGVCHSDVHLHDGFFDLGADERLDITGGRSLPFTLGHEVEGEVVALGSEAEGVAPGERVVVYPWIGCDDCAACQRGDGHLCARPRQVGVSIDGGYAEYCLVPDAKYLFGYGPADPALAATYACSGITAYSALAKAGLAETDEPMLIVGLGGVGMAALAFATTRSRTAPLVADIDPAKREAALAAGATAAFDSADPGAAKAVRALTAGGVFAALDFVGCEGSFAFANGCVRKGGRLVVVGLLGGRLAMPLPMLPLRALTIAGSYVGSLEEFRTMMEEVRAGGLSPIPIETRPLEEAGRTLDDLRGGRVLGRVVLVP